MLFRSVAGDYRSGGHPRKDELFANTRSATGIGHRVHHNRPDGYRIHEFYGDSVISDDMINASLQPHLPLIISLFEKHKVKDAYLFGSALTDNFDEKSDVDFLVNFNADIDPLEKGELMWSLRFSLEDDLNRTIDLITESSLKNPYFIEELNETKQKIYG